MGDSYEHSMQMEPHHSSSVFTYTPDETSTMIIKLHTHMICRGSNSILNYSNSIYRICIAMKTNIILRCNRNYKPSVSHLVCRKRGSTMGLAAARKQDT